MGRVFLSRASRRPPTDRGDGADLSKAARPSWILLDFSAYVANECNSTTATCKFRGDKDFQVTFFPADPPLVSYFCIYCSGLKTSDYATEPKVLATEANLVLFRVAIGTPQDLCYPSAHEYFIYSAGGDGPGDAPSLEHLLHPYPYIFHDTRVGLLSYDTGGYTVAALRDDSSSLYRQDGPVGPGHYDVCILHSRDKVWASRAVNVPLQEQQKQSSVGFCHDTSKVITIGGERGTMAFVDLWRGILQYDVLGDDPSLRYTLLPEISLGRKEYSVNPLYTRDIAVVKGHIKYVEMLTEVKRSTGSDGWKAATWSMLATTTNPEDTWLPEGNLEASNIRDHKNLLRFVLPKLNHAKGQPQPTLGSLHTGHPALSLHNDDIVYFMAKVEPMDIKACVIAVDMKRQVVEGVAEFGAERTRGISWTYMHSRISSYLKMAPGTKDASLKMKKKGMMKGASSKKETKSSKYILAGVGSKGA
uniref:Uncharacterized protein n=1 Tax=Arundo donax TaxID=35708 RepID=A0A0A9TT88_ARUDO